MLVGMDHPKDDGTVQDTTCELRDSHFLLKLLAVKGLEAWTAWQHTAMLVWAARIATTSVLTAVETQLHRHARKSIGMVIPNAVRNGHAKVLQWLHVRRLLLPPARERHNTTVVELVEFAAQHNRIECLGWLIATFDVSVLLITRMICFAAIQRDVRMLTKGYTLQSLALSLFDRRRVDACHF